MVLITPLSTSNPAIPSRNVCSARGLVTSSLCGSSTYSTSSAMFSRELCAYLEVTVRCWFSSVCEISFRRKHSMQRHMMSKHRKAGLTLFQTVPVPSKKYQQFRFGHPHSHVHLQLEIETFIGSSLFGEPLQLTSGIQRKNYLHTKQRPLWLHVSIFTHFNQPSTLRQSHVPDTKNPRSGSVLLCKECD